MGVLFATYRSRQEWDGVARGTITAYDTDYPKAWTVTYEADGVTEEFSVVSAPLPMRGGSLPCPLSPAGEGMPRKGVCEEWRHEWGSLPRKLADIVYGGTILARLSWGFIVCFCV